MAISGNRYLDIPMVSTYVISVDMPRRSALAFIKLTSKSALWATRTASPQNERNSGSTVSIVGASLTIALSMDVRAWILGDITLLTGWTNVEYLSVTLRFSTFTAPISMISSVHGENPVVSISNTTNVPSSFWPLSFVTVFCRSFTRYPSTP